MLLPQIRVTGVLVASGKNLKDSYSSSFEDKERDDLANNKGRTYPEIITQLPEADIHIQGIKAWILQGEKHQLVFFEMKLGAQVPQHSHDYDQWGLVIEGKMELTINGKTRLCQKGDEYVIPARASHSAKFLSKSRVMDFFSERSRYKTKVA